MWSCHRLTLCAGLFFLLRPVAALEFDSFRAVVGLDEDASGTPGSVVFQVWVDEEKKFDSGVMRAGSPPQAVRVNVQGAQELKLTVEDAGDGPGCDRADWADARLIDEETSAVLFLSDLPEESEQVWIPMRRDYTVLERPLRVGGVTYAKGLGSYSGNVYVYRRWNEIYAERQADAAQAEAAARRALGDDLVLTGSLAPAAQLRVDGQSVAPSEPLALPLRHVQRLTLLAIVPKGTGILGHPALAGLAITDPDGGLSLPLGACHSVRFHHAPDLKNVPILAGKPYLGALGTGRPVRVEFQGWATALWNQRRARQKLREVGAGRLFSGVIGVDSRQERPAATVRFQVWYDDVPVYDSGLLCDRDPPRRFALPFGAIETLRLVVDDGGDGLLDDVVNWADLQITGPQGGALSDFRPSRVDLEWGPLGVDRSVVGGTMRLGDETFGKGFGTVGRSLLEFEPLTLRLERRSQARALARQGMALLDAGRTQAAQEQFAAALALDEGVAEVYPGLASVAAARGDEYTAWQWTRRLFDRGHPTFRQRQEARRRLERFQTRVLAVPSERRPRHEPPLHCSSPDAPVRVTALAQGLFSLPLSAPREVGRQLWPAAGEVWFRVEPAQAGQVLSVLLNSRWLEIDVAIVAGPGAPGPGPRARGPESGLCAPCALLRAAEGRRPKAEGQGLFMGSNRKQVWAQVARQRNPLLTWRLQPGVFALRVTHDPRLEGFESPFKIYAAARITPAWPTPPMGSPRTRFGGEQEPATEGWHYEAQSDGSAQVTVALTGLGIVNVPYTAEDVQVEGGASYLAEPAFEYGSTLSMPYPLGRLLLVRPEGTTATVRFNWRDGAYDVTPAHYDRDRVDRTYWHSLYGVNGAVQRLEVRYTLTGTAEKAVRIVPANYRLRGRTYIWHLRPHEQALVEAQDPAVVGAFLSQSYRHLTVYLPDNAHNRRWLPEYAAILRRIYDRQAALVGDAEPEEVRFIGVPGAAQLPGFGGATWADPQLSESWVGSTGHVTEYHLRYHPGLGPEAHELMWVFLQSVPEDAPRWLRQAMRLFLEREGALAGGYAFPDHFWRSECWEERAARYFRAYTEPGAGYFWLEEEALRTHSQDEQRTADAALYALAKALETRYGPTFWGRFWQAQRADPQGCRDLSEREKTIQVVQAMQRLTGDHSLRRQFERWGFDLSPGPRAPGSSSGPQRSAGRRTLDAIVPLAKKGANDA